MGGCHNICGVNITDLKILEACTNLCYDQPHGALFIVETQDQPYQSYYKHERQVSYEKDRPMNILNGGDIKLIKALSSLDGATIVKSNGDVTGFCATLEKSKEFLGHGKRHEFACSTSTISNLVAILASEEDKRIRMFREGICISEVDSTTKMPVSIQNKLLEIVDTPISKMFIASGIAVSILTLNPIPAIITITGSTVVVSYGFEKLKKLFSG